MTLIRGIDNYLFSTDYEALWELAQKQSVVCDVSYYGCRDIAQTICSLGPNPVVQVSARGIGYVYADSLEDFVVGCQGCDLRWIVPIPEPLPLSKHKPLPKDCDKNSCCWFGKKVSYAHKWEWVYGNSDVFQNCSYTHWLPQSVNPLPAIFPISND